MRTTQDVFQKMRDDGEKIAILTCYDSSFAILLENAGVDILLVGDSLGNVLQGEESYPARYACRYGLSYALRCPRLKQRIHHGRHALRNFPGEPGRYF